MGASIAGEKSGAKRLGTEFEKSFVRTGASATRREAKADIAKQQKKEELALAEAEDAVGRAGITGKRKGRRSLIKSSPTGLATNLGGTA